jgi:hypothetical protein
VLIGGNGGPSMAKRNLHSLIATLVAGLKELLHPPPIGILGLFHAAQINLSSTAV